MSVRLSTQERSVYNPMLDFGFSMLEGQQVILLRLLRICRGGMSAEREAERMVSEKIDAAVHTGMMLASGATPLLVARYYQNKISANRKRLSHRRGQ